MLPSSYGYGLGLRTFRLSGLPVRSLSLRPGNSPTTPYGGRVNGLQIIAFAPPCHPNYGALALTPAGLSPAERASLCWTHMPYIGFSLGTARSSSARKLTAALPDTIALTLSLIPGYVGAVPGLTVASRQRPR